MSYRVGIGFDIHRLVEGRPLILGGISVEYEKGLLGHSDGDVITHAVCDAILGALALGDIGQYYPDTDEGIKGIDSMYMLKEIAASAQKTHKLVNIDANCICEKPKLSAYRDRMTNRIADTCNIDPSCVSIKFRTHEGLGEIGKGEAIAAQAVSLLQKITDKK